MLCSIRRLLAGGWCAYRRFNFFELMRRQCPEDLRGPCLDAVKAIKFQRERLQRRAMLEEISEVFYKLTRRVSADATQIEERLEFARRMLQKDLEAPSASKAGGSAAAAAAKTAVPPAPTSVPVATAHPVIDAAAVHESADLIRKISTIRCELQLPAFGSSAQVLALACADLELDKFPPSTSLEEQADAILKLLF
jgi:hypothetical protein